MDNAEQKSEWSQRELGALWKRESPNQKYLTGKLQVDGKEVNVVVFSNRHKSKDNQPDFRVYKSEPRNQNSENSQGSSDSGQQEEEMI